MDKPTKKRNKYSTETLTILLEKFDCSYDFLTKSIRGDRVGDMSDQIKKEYSILEKKAKELKQQIHKELQEKANQLK